MADIVTQKNIGALVTIRDALDSTSITAGGAGDNTVATGPSIDRFAAGMPESAVFATRYFAGIGSGNTLTVQSTVQDSADNVTFTDFASEAATLVGTGPSGGGLVRGTRAFAVDLTNARRYIRFRPTPDLNRASTDTAELSAVAVLGGSDRLAAVA